MNKQLSSAELERLSTSNPAVTPHVMSRRDKLMRLAKIVRESVRQFIIFSNLEHCAPYQRSALQHPNSAFAAAAADPILKDAGLSDGTVGNAEAFFELNLQDLHTFSCNCGGAISNDDMANRIEHIASRV